MISMLTSRYANIPADNIRPILPQLREDTNKAFWGLEKKAPKNPNPSPLLTSTLGCKEHRQGQPLFHNQPHSGNWGTSRSQDCQSPPERFKRKKKKITKFYVLVTLVDKKRCVKNAFRIYIQQKTQHMLNRHTLSENDVRQTILKC